MPSPSTPATMLERLGNVCFWTGCIAFIPVFLYGFTYMDIYEQRDVGTLVKTLDGLVLALPLWLAGLALRYIFTGRAIR